MTSKEYNELLCSPKKKNRTPYVLIWKTLQDTLLTKKKTGTYAPFMSSKTYISMYLCIFVHAYILCMYVFVWTHMYMGWA